MERKSNDMTKTIISSAVAVVCVAALCITYAVTGKKAAAPETTTAPVATPQAVAAAAESDDYMTEAEAAAYIGVPADIMTMMRESLGQFKGAYMIYMYTDAEGNEAEAVVYNKDALNKAVTKLSEETGAYNFRTLQERMK